MKRFLLVLLIITFTLSVIFIESGCREIVESTTQEVNVEPKIIFTSYRDINSEIYIMNIDGSGQTNLTNNSADDYGARFSPDGSKIAFVSYRDENWEIYVMDSNGKNPVRLTNNDSEDTQPYWSPDGSSITFSSDRDGYEKIYIMNSDGSGQRELLNNNFTSHLFSWSPDGSKIAFESSGDIYVMNVDGSEQTNLTSNPANDQGPIFSHDGSKIAFVSDRDGNDEIYIMNADGSDQTRLTYNSKSDYLGWDYGPHFSPDGSKIIFMSHRDVREAEIYIMNADGSEQSRLTYNQVYDMNPSFSPDGSKIVFTSYWDGNEEIYIMNTDGSEQKRLTDNIMKNTTPCFSPEGAMIFIASDYESKEEEKDEDEICIEVSERSPRNVQEELLVYYDEDLLFEESDFIFKGTVIDEKEIYMEEYEGGDDYYLSFFDVFTFRISKIYYSDDPSIKIGDTIRIANSSCSNEWTIGTIEMQKGKEYIVLAEKIDDYSYTVTTEESSYEVKVELSKCTDYFTTDYWESIIIIENGDYIFDEEYKSLISGAKKEIIREDGDFKTKMYIKGKEFEKELEELILEKKGEN